MDSRNTPRGIQHWIGMLQVHNIVRLFLALQADARVSPLLKFYAWCGLIYVFSPLDVMPELFTGIGLLDDIIVSLIIMQSLMELAPRHVVDHHCARLGIRPEQVFISVPQTVREARSLYTFVREFGAGFREAGAPPETAPATGTVPPAAAAEDVSATGAPPAGRPGSRYSAYRAGDAED